MYAADPIRIRVKYNQTIKLIFAGDLHWASEECMTPLWWRMFKENDDAYFFGTGDWLHMINPSDKRWAGTALRDEFMTYPILSKVCQAEIEDLASRMEMKLGKEWIKEHILGGVSGNHPFKKHKDYGFDVWEMFCKRLGILHLGYSCIVPLILHVSKDGKNSARVFVLIHHGFGAAKQTEGGDVTSFTRHAMPWDAHICVYGHTHNKWSKRVVISGWAESKKGPMIIEKYTKVVGQSGTFQRTLSASDGPDRGRTPSWGETKGYPLRDLGWLTVFISLRRLRTGGRQNKWLDINSME